MKPARESDAGDLGAPSQIEIIDFEPTDPKAARVRRPRRWWPAVLGLVALLLSSAMWFVFTARSVWVEIDPPPDTIKIDAGVLKIRWKDHFLVRSGRITVQADKQGYYPLRETALVGAEQNQNFKYRLTKLPGFLSLEIQPGAPGAAIWVDDAEWPVAADQAAELIPGVHQLRIEAPRFQRFDGTVDIEGGGLAQTEAVTLTPDWAEVSLSSQPAGAEILVDGVVGGKTPAMVEILSGEHTIGLRAKGRKPWERPIRVIANEHQVVPEVSLEKADGLLTVESHPPGATLRVNGRFRGQTPLSLRLPPERTYALTVSKAGFEAARRDVSIASDEDTDIDFALVPMIGQVRFRLDPPEAELRINGEIVTDHSNVLDLPAIDHTIDITAPGYVAHSQSVLPRPNFTQDVTVNLITLEEAREASLKKEIVTAAGQTMKLMRPRPFTMGASRRERGRRANETIRQADLTAEFYVSTTEITNKQFRSFDAGHESGTVFKVGLNGDDHPVVNVTWEQAVRYCNWLSKRDSLPLAYEEHGGRMRPTRVSNTGYRLPSEAEWAWTSRFEGRADSPRFPWGEDLPPAADSGNYADRSSLGLVNVSLKKYNDGFAATAPVASFPAGASGLFDLGGNVGEWTNDVYSVGTSADLVALDGAISHVVRGSSWMHASIGELRLTYRDYSDDKRPDVGFRIARSLE